MSQATVARDMGGWSARADLDLQAEDSCDSVSGRLDSQAGRILLFLKAGAETALIEDGLQQADLLCYRCADARTLVAELRQGAAAILLMQEMLDQSTMSGLVEELGRQPSWSDIPLLFLSNNGTDSIQASQRMLAMLEPLGHVIVLERPLHLLSLLSALRSALQSRRRQYEVRDLLIRLQDEVRHRDEFLMLLAHEVRNPLGAMRNALQVLTQVGSQTNLAIEQRAVIGRQTGILSSLIDDVLEVFQVTTGRVRLHKQLVDLTELAGRCLHSLQATTGQRHILALTVASSPLIVEGDPQRLGQLIGQLVTNAVKNTPPGGRVALTLDTVEGQAVLRVRDSGPGLTNEQLSHVFDLFPPPDRFPEQWQGGLSIALPIVRSLALLHGGVVRASSPGPGKGTELEVHLPLQKSVMPLSAKPPLPPPAAPPRHILIIEDNPDGRETLRLLLQLWNHKVEVAVDGKEGISKALSGRPEVALVDIGLPEMDGYQVARQLRQVLGPNIRLIAMTGYGQFHDSRRAGEAGFDHHLIKPVDPEELQHLLA